VYETEKLTEARYFLGRMRQAEIDWNEAAFSHELSAFLTAARSVLQYLHIAAETRANQQWYQAAVATDPSIKFLKEQRDLNIHTRPVPLAAAESQTPGPVVQGEQCATVERMFFIWDWNGTETAVALAERYLGAIEAVVTDARARRIIGE
jgi:hypothetical protein